MKDIEILLHDNHKRSLTSTLMIVEQLLIEIEDLMQRPYNTCCFEIKNDIDSDAINQNLKVTTEALKLICQLQKKYNTDKKVQSLQRIIDTKKTKIWEILHDSKSRRMKGFGDFPQRFIKDYDKDIDDLMAMSEKIVF
jgi:hypothetical protein